MGGPTRGIPEGESPFIEQLRKISVAADKTADKRKAEQPDGRSFFESVKDLLASTGRNIAKAVRFKEGGFQKQLDKLQGEISALKSEYHSLRGTMPGRTALCKEINKLRQEWSGQKKELQQFPDRLAAEIVKVARFLRPEPSPKYTKAVKPKEVSTKKSRAESVLRRDAESATPESLSTLETETELLERPESSEEKEEEEVGVAPSPAKESLPRTEEKPKSGEVKTAPLIGPKVTLSPVQMAEVKKKTNVEALEEKIESTRQYLESLEKDLKQLSEGQEQESIKKEIESLKQDLQDLGVLYLNTPGKQEPMAGIGLREFLKFQDKFSENEVEKRIITMQDEMAKPGLEAARRNQESAKQNQKITEENREAVIELKDMHKTIQTAIAERKKLKFIQEGELDAKSKSFMLFMPKKTSKKTLLDIIRFATEAIARSSVNPELADPQLISTLNDISADLKNEYWKNLFGKSETLSTAKETLEAMIKDISQKIAAQPNPVVAAQPKPEEEGTTEKPDPLSFVFGLLTSPTTLDRDKFQLDYLRAYRGIFKGKKEETVVMQSINQSMGLFKYLEKQFKSASLYEKQEILKMISIWLLNPEINNGDWKDDAVKKQINLIAEAAKNSSPLLANFARDQIENKLKEVEQEIPASLPPLTESQNPIDLNVQLDAVANGDLKGDPYDKFLDNFASDLTQVSLRNLKQVAPSEYFMKGEPKPIPGSQAVNQGTQLSNYVIMQILSRETPRERANLIEFFLKVQSKLIDLDNEVLDYASYANIGHGLVNLSVSRLKKTFSKTENAEKVDKLVDELLPAKMRMQTREQLLPASESEYGNAVIPPLSIFRIASTTIDDLHLDDPLRLTNDIQVLGGHMEDLVSYQTSSKDIDAKPLSSNILSTVFGSQVPNDDKNPVSKSDKLFNPRAEEEMKYEQAFYERSKLLEPSIQV